MRSEELQGTGVIGQRVTLNIVDAIVLRQKIEALKKLLPTFEEDGRPKKTGYDRMSREQTNALMSILVFNEKLINKLDVDFTQTENELFDGKWDLFKE